MHAVPSHGRRHAGTPQAAILSPRHCEYQGGWSALERYAHLYCFKFTCCSGLIPKSHMQRETLKEAVPTKNATIIPAAMWRSKVLFLASKIYFCPMACHLVPLSEVCSLPASPSIISCTVGGWLFTEQGHGQSTCYSIVSEEEKPDIPPDNFNPPALCVCLGSKLGFRYRTVIKHLLIFGHTSSCRKFSWITHTLELQTYSADSSSSHP